MIKNYDDNNGKPWYSALDILTVLGYKNPKQILNYNKRSIPRNVKPFVEKGKDRYWNSISLARFKHLLDGNKKLDNWDVLESELSTSRYTRVTSSAIKLKEDIVVAEIESKAKPTKRKVNTLSKRASANGDIVSVLLNKDNMFGSFNALRAYCKRYKIVLGASGWKSLYNRYSSELEGTYPEYLDLMQAKTGVGGKVSGKNTGSSGDTANKGIAPDKVSNTNSNTSSSVKENLFKITYYRIGASRKLPNIIGKWFGAKDERITIIPKELTISEVQKLIEQGFVITSVEEVGDE